MLIFRNLVAIFSSDPRLLHIRWVQLEQGIDAIVARHYRAPVGAFDLDILAAFMNGRQRLYSPTPTPYSRCHSFPRSSDAKSKVLSHSAKTHSVTDYETSRCFDRVIGFQLCQRKFRPCIQRALSSGVKFGTEFWVSHHTKEIH